LFGPDLADTIAVQGSANTAVTDDDMSAFRTMLGRELPCGLGQMLEFHTSSHPDHARLADLARLGQLPPGEVLQLAGSELAAGRFDRVLALVEETWPASRPGPWSILAALAHEALGQYSQAARRLDALLAPGLSAEGVPPLPVLACAAGLAYEHAGSWRTAARRYMRALQWVPSERFAHHRLIAMALAHGRFGRAGQHLRDYLRHWPADRTARVALAHLLHAGGHHQQAVWEYEQALCLEPDGGELPEEVAAEIVAGGDHAITLLERLVGRQPYLPGLRLRLANLHSLRGDEATANYHYEKALGLHPEYLDRHIAAARHCLRFGRSGPAAGHFRQAIVINDLNVETHIGLAQALAASRRSHQGRHMVRTACRLARNSALLAAELALLEHGAAETELRPERLEALLGAARLLLRRNPLWNDLRLACAGLLWLLGRRTAACRACAQATRTDPQSPEAWMALGVLQADGGREWRAADALARAISCDWTRAQLEYQLALIHSRQLSFALTLERLERDADNAADVNRRIWSTLDTLQLCGPSRRPALTIPAASAL
jgi:Flp pilus assembly protein TadD